jgi:diguanylate cyclase (GGDEF)-like protein/PAS domain S-box-containing protein
MASGSGGRGRTAMVVRVTAMVGAVVVMVTLVGWAFRNNEAERREAQLRRFDARAVTGAGFVQAYVSETQSRQSRLATAAMRGPVTQASFDQIIRYAGFRSGVLLDSRGRLIGVSPQAPHLLGTEVVSKYPHLRPALDGRRTVSGVIQSLVEDIPIIAFSVPFLTPQGWRVLGASYAISDTPLYSFLNNAAPFDGSQTYVVDTSGSVVSAGGDAQGTGPRLSDHDAAVADLLGARSSGFVGSGAGERYVTSVKIRNAPWLLVFVAPTTALYEQPVSDVWRMQWAALAGFALVCLVAIVLFERNLAQRQRWRSVLDTAEDAFVGMDGKGRVTDWNAAATATFGWPASAALGCELAELLVPERQRAAFRAGLAEFHATGHHPLPDGPVESIALTRGGAELPVELTVSSMKWRGGWHVHGFVRDITERVRAAGELAAAERRFRVAFDSAPVPMALAALESDPGRLTRVNAALCGLLGYPAEQLEARTLSDVAHPDDRDATDALVARMAAGDAVAAESDVRCLHADGHAVWVELSVNVISDGDGAPRYAVTQLDDVTDRRAETERLNALALQDPLTGLANRLLLADRLAQAIVRTSRSYRMLAVLLCDLDGFKPVNDRHGHAAGDAVLREVAARIRTAVRPADTVARIGGDEFVVLCEDLEDLQPPDALARRIIEAVGEPFTVHGVQVRVGISVGMAVGEGPGLDADAMLAEADRNMYAQKRRPGRLGAVAGG